MLYLMSCSFDSDKYAPNSSFSGRNGSSGGPDDAPTTNTYNSRNTALSLSASVFGSRLSTKSVSSLVKLAMSANFPNSLINQVE